MLQFYSCTFIVIKILLVFNGFPENNCIIVSLKASSFSHMFPIETIVLMALEKIVCSTASKTLAVLRNCSISCGVNV